MMIKVNSKCLKLKIISNSVDGAIMYAKLAQVIILKQPQV